MADNEETQNSTEEIKDYTKSIVDLADIMTSLKGMIYNKIVSGGEAGSASEDNFFCWATPGIAVTPEDFEFVSEGLRGSLRLDKIKASNMKAMTEAQAVLQAAAEKAVQEAEENPDGKAGGISDDITDSFLNLQLSDEDIQTMKADKTFKLYLQAESLSHLVDFIPDVSGWKESGGTKLCILENEGKLSDVYKYTLNMSQVKADDMDEATKKQVEEYRAALVDTVKMPPMVSGMPEEEITQPSRLVSNYNTMRQAYEDAALQLKLEQAEALSGNDPAAMHRWALTGKILKSRVESAMNAWITTGYKKQYEYIAAFIDQVESRSMVMQKEEYRRLFDSAYMTGLGSGMEFLYTTLIPNNFIKAGSWTKLSFTQKDYNYENEITGKSCGLNVDASLKIGRAKASAEYNKDTVNNTEKVTVNMKNFKIEFEICQVSIDRPWFKPSFLNSKYWRFTPGGKDENGNEIVEMLCDGSSTHKGMMPAYPTAILFIRNLSIKFNSDKEARDFAQQREDISHGANASYKGILVSASGGYNYSSTDGSTTNNSSSQVKGSTITIDGMQIIGYRCHVLGKAPNPLPSITEWV